MFVYRGAVIKKKKSATVISAEKYHKLILKNNSDDFLEASSSPNKNEKKTHDFRELMLRRLHEIPGEENQSAEDKGSENQNKEEIWNEQKLADQEHANFEDDDEQHIEKLIIIGRKKRMSALSSPKNLRNHLDNRKKSKN